MRRRHVSTRPSPYRPGHQQTHVLPLPSGKRGGKSLGHTEPPLHHSTAPAARPAAAPAIIDGAKYQLGLSLEHGGVFGEEHEKGKGKRNWGLVTLPKQKCIYRNNNNNNIVWTDLLSVLGLGQSGILSILKCFGSARFVFFLNFLQYYDTIRAGLIASSNV